MSTAGPADASLIDSRTAAWRLLVTVLLVTLGNSAMYVVSVVLPAVQSEFGISRANASLPYTFMMVCLGLGGLFTGRWADRFGIARVLWLGSAAVLGGYVLAALSGNVWMFGLAHGLLGLLGGAATFAPLMADTGLWWNKRRGMAMAVCASGNYIAGTLWPSLAQWGITHYGWRPTYIALGLVCGIGMALLAFYMRRPPPALALPATGAAAAPRATIWPPGRPFGLAPAHAQWLLCVAGVACCVAMAMPQVHIVAYCTDLGFGAARGAEMLSLMLASGIISRLAGMRALRAIRRTMGMKMATTPVELMNEPMPATTIISSTISRASLRPALLTSQSPSICATPVRTSASPTTKSAAMRMMLGSAKPANACSTVMTPESGSATIIINATASIRGRPIANMTMAEISRARTRARSDIVPA